jgi:hypothetical protein
MSQPAPYERDLAKTPELPESMQVFARIEDLVGQEYALLRIPASERTREQRDLLHAIGAELDRVREALRARGSRADEGHPAAETPH